MKKLIFLLFFVSSVIAVHSQESTLKNFTHKPIVNIFTHYHHDFGEGEGIGGFGLKRTLIGYQFNYKKELKVEFSLDFGDTKIASSNLDLVAFIKNAYVSWSRWGFTASMGMVRTNNFAFQENFWGHRYVAKSYCDEHDFGSSADIGITLAYKPLSWFSMDFQVTNGEGYKVVKLDNTQRYGLGMTFEPTKGYFVRGYYDAYTPDVEVGSYEHKMALMTGYRNERFNIGLEYNQKWNKNFVLGNNLAGTSLYSTVNIIKQLSVFVRYDYSFINTSQSNIYAGVEYTPYKFLSISPNVNSEIDHNTMKHWTSLSFDLQLKI